MSRTLTVNIVNRNYPPYPGITGESAAEVAEYLTGLGMQVNAIHVDAPYQAQGTARAPVGRSHTVRTFYNGKHKLLRLFGNLYEAVRLVQTARRLEADVTIYLTDPPFLNICAALLHGRRHPWILWSMDLFPEGFSASHLVSRRNPLYRLLDAIVRRTPPAHVIALGQYQAAYLAGKFPPGMDFTILPCGIHGDAGVRGDGATPSWAADAGSRMILGYCGNLGEAHSVEFLRAVVDNLDPARHRLVLALYGSRAAEALAYATGKPGVEILPFVRRDDLRFIDVHLASLKAEWVNVCVPSKTVSSVCSGATFLYFGIPESDNWGLLKEAGWLLDAGDGSLDEEVRSWMARSGAQLDEKRANARRVAASLSAMKRDAFESIGRVIQRIAGHAPDRVDAPEPLPGAHVA